MATSSAQAVGRAIATRRGLSASSSTVKGVGSSLVKPPVVVVIVAGRGLVEAVSTAKSRGTGIRSGTGSSTLKDIGFYYIVVTNSDGTLTFIPKF